MKFLFGADPELFVKKGNKIVSGHGLIKGDKKNPFKVDNGAVQVDGMALEFNIDPAMTEEGFVFNLESVMEQLQRMVPDYSLQAVPVAHFTKAYMDKQPEEATILGCDPDYNAWSGKQNETPDGKVNFRTAAGHIHVGWTEGANANNKEHIENSKALIRQMDYYLGLPSLIYDRETQRRSLYGKAGAYRIKSYGVEYRVLSNKWLASKELMAWAFRASKQAAQDLISGKVLQDKYGDIQEIINTSNVKEALGIIHDAKLEVPQ